MKEVFVTLALFLVLIAATFAAVVFITGGL